MSHPPKSYDPLSNSRKIFVSQVLALPSGRPRAVRRAMKIIRSWTFNKLEKYDVWRDRAVGRRPILLKKSVLGFQPRIFGNNDSSEYACVNHYYAPVDLIISNVASKKRARSFSTLSTICGHS
jgi:hypothetical protein